MRYSVEHQRNIAFDLIECDQKNIDISLGFEEGEPVIIYGYDFLGKEVYRRIANRVNVIGFIDRAYNNEIFDGVEIYSLSNEKLEKIIKAYDRVKVFVTIMSYYSMIQKDLLVIADNLVFVTPYELFVRCKFQKEAEFYADMNSITRETLRDVVTGNRSSFSSVILLGTTYTMLLSMLYLPDWKESLFIFERFFPEEVYYRMKEMGYRCIYERYATQYYDLSYIIADYVKKQNIQVWGHDHMQFARAFLESKIVVLEDGLGNYDKKYSLRYIPMLDDGRMYYPLGYDDLVNRVILTGMFEIPNELIPKVTLIKPRDLWEKKNVEEQKKILEIMGLQISDYERNEPIVMLLTEPCIINSIELMMEPERMNYYREILKNYKGYSIWIKPHPSEKVSYNRYFEDCYILPRSFPVQLLDWCDIKISRILVKKNSSCLNIFSDKYKIDVFD